MKLADVTSAAVSELWESVEAKVSDSEALEVAAQTLAKGLHTHFDESVVIARVFVTVPYGDLPDFNRDFVDNLVSGAGVQDELNASTPVLSLVGTHGHESAWCDRLQSQGHVGIPLISSSFVGSIPMITRLLQELGLSLDWVDSQDSGVLVETIGHSAGLFYVEDAAETKDSEGRDVIAAQDFVAAHNVKSVFGTGRAYGGGQLAVVVVFCRDQISREAAEEFIDLANLFHNKTAGLAATGKVFA